jgi:hypothetical protein
MTEGPTNGGAEPNDAPPAAQAQSDPLGDPPPAPQPNLSPAAPPVAPPSAAQAYAGAVAVAQPAARKGGRLRALIVIGVIVAILAVILYLVRNNVQANDLKVGDCFVIPTETTVKTVETHPCTESHNAEVVFVGEYSGDTYPISISLESYVSDNCVPASAAYVGRSLDDEPALYIGYFAPTRDSWDNGDRSITCYAAREDEAMTTESLRK